MSEMKNKKEHSSFIDNIWGADLANVWLISKFNGGIHFLLCVIDTFSKYTGVFLWKIKSIQVLMLFTKF